MRICAFWDCSREISEEESFCHEHGPKLNRGLIDQCPKCGRFKDTRYKLCPDCRYGRPIPEWKIRNRNLKTASYIEVEPPEKADSGDAESESADSLDIRGILRYSRGEAECPRCGSSDLTYKSVFDYYKCNSCKSTFITPVYSYNKDKEKEKEESGIESTKDLARQIFSGTQPKRLDKNELPRQVFVGIPTERPLEKEERKSSVSVREQHKLSNRGWLILFLVICIVVIIAVVVWAILGNPMEDLLGGLLNGTTT